MCSIRPPGSRIARCLLAALALLVALDGAAGERLRLYTNQDYIEDVTRRAVLPLGDIKAMFAFVLSSLPGEVRVYPTESYYYFTFHHLGVKYAGNIRLDASDRDNGTVHFAYFEDYQEWTEGQPIQYRALGAADGVVVEKMERLVYRVSLGEKRVVFRLNDLSGVKPPAQVLGSNEKYLGPVFDESGMRFFLVFNPVLKIFHFVLDETVRVNDRLQPAAATDRILIGLRTGFAYYRDTRLDRKILIGVHEGNSRVNNQFDGPFDQLPDSFVRGDELRQAILTVDPSLAGRIDRFGGSPDGSGRFLIAPYLHYGSEGQLQIFHDCATDKRVGHDAYYQCFVIDSADYGAPQILPLAMKNLLPKAGQPR